MTLAPRCIRLQCTSHDNNTGKQHDELRFDHTTTNKKTKKNFVTNVAESLRRVFFSRVCDYVKMSAEKNECFSTTHSFREE